MGDSDPADCCCVAVTSGGLPSCKREKYITRDRPGQAAPELDVHIDREDKSLSMRKLLPNVEDSLFVVGESGTILELTRKH